MNRQSWWYKMGVWQAIQCVFRISSMPPNTASSSIPALPAKRYRPFFIIDLFCLCALIVASIGFAESMSTIHVLPTAMLVLFFSLIALAFPLSITLHSSWNIGAKFAVFGTAIFFILFLMNCVEPIDLFACLSSLLISILYFSGSKTVTYRHAFRWSSGVLCVTVLLTPVYLILFPDPQYVGLLEVREQFPITDISARLVEYQSPVEAEFPIAIPVTSLETNEELELLEAWFESRHAPRWLDGLKDIHGAKFEKFVRTPSLAVVVGRPSVFRIPDVEPSPLVSFQLEKQTESGKESSRENADREKRQFFLEFETQPSWFPENRFEFIHRRAYVNFLHPMGLGHSPAFQELVRFNSLSMRFITLSAPWNMAKWNCSWKSWN